MNGIISESASSSSVSKPKLITSIILGTCLFAGFVSGMNISPASLTHLNPFRTETIQFGKISWISAENQHEFKIANAEAESTPAELLRTSELAFVPFELKTANMKRYRFGFNNRKRVNFLKLEQAVNAVKEATRYDAFEDYQTASSRLRNDFALAMNETPVGNKSEMIAVAASSAEVNPVPVLIPAARPQTYEEASSAVNTPTNELSPADILEIEAKKTSRPVVSTVKPVVARKAHKAPAKVTPVIEESISTIASSSEVSPRQNVDETPSQKMNTQVVSIQTKQIPYALSSKDEVSEVVTSSELSLEEQKKLTDTLLAVQVTTAKKNAVNPAQAVQREVIATRAKAAEQANMPDSDPVAYDPSDYEAPKVTAQSKTGTAVCDTLDNHEFVRPNGPTHPGLDSQICPNKVSWISKTRGKTGWVKVEGNDYLPTLTLHPAPNQGPTLLIDQNALALIALKSGVHVTKGMGLILGVVPEGFKVNYEGRAEETEYFESSGKSYFAILNAEPGAGVVSVESKTNPNFSSTVFTPVLDDTISYLDLSAPVARNLNIKVVKGGSENDPEVAKLTVGLSTQQGIQAITRADGQTTLRNVNLIPGFPVYVDVSSHTEDAGSYTYRYELKHPRRSGMYVVSQISENTIHHWLAQVKQGLSDQSAMVVGIYDRKKLDGFRNPHYTQVSPLTAKYGLEPMNYTVLWDGKLSSQDPLEGDVPRFMSVQVPEGLSQVNLLNEAKQVVSSELIPISPRVIHVISE